MGILGVFTNKKCLASLQMNEKSVKKEETVKKVEEEVAIFNYVFRYHPKNKDKVQYLFQWVILVILV